jgi:lysophospholipase L1-like esterase
MLPSKVGKYDKDSTFKAFSANNLFDYMNGNAHYLLDKGFLCLGVQEYRNNKRAMLLELYQFESRNGAQLIYQDETAGSLDKIKIGEAGSFEDCYLAFFLKNYFAKIICFDDWQGNESEGGSKDNNSNDDLKKLGKSIEGVLITQTEGYLVANKEKKIAVNDLNKGDSPIVLIGASYAKGLSLDEIDDMRFINKGVSGEQSFEMLSRFDEDVILMKPKAVIIWGFINDIFRSDRQNIDASLERVKTSFEQMVKLSKDNEIIPILATEVTVRPKDSWKESLAGWIGGLLGKESYQDYVNQHVMDVNKWLRNYADQHDLLLLDLHAVISEGNGRRQKEYATKDGSHISQKGYEKLTEYAHGVLEQYFEDQ